MSYSTWHNYGYGIRVDDIKEQSVERLQALLKLAAGTGSEDSCLVIGVRYCRTRLG